MIRVDALFGWVFSEELSSLLYLQLGEVTGAGGEKKKKIIQVVQC